MYLCKLLILLFSDRVTDVTDKYNDFPCVRACVRTHGTFQNISVTSVTLSPSYIIFGGSGEAVPIAIRSDRISSAERPFPSLYYSSSRLLVKRTSFSRPTLQRYKIIMVPATLRGTTRGYYGLKLPQTDNYNKKVTKLFGSL